MQINTFAWTRGCVILPNYKCYDIDRDLYIRHLKSFTKFVKRNDFKTYNFQKPLNCYNFRLIMTEVANWHFFYEVHLNL